MCAKRWCYVVSDWNEKLFSFSHMRASATVSVDYKFSTLKAFFRIFELNKLFSLHSISSRTYWRFFANGWEIYFVCLTARDRKGLWIHKFDSIIASNEDTKLHNLHFFSLISRFSPSGFCDLKGFPFNHKNVFSTRALKQKRENLFSRKLSAQNLFTQFHFSVYQFKAFFRLTCQVWTNLVQNFRFTIFTTLLFRLNFFIIEFPDTRVFYFF